MLGNDLDFDLSMPRIFPRAIELLKDLSPDWHLRLSVGANLPAAVDGAHHLVQRENILVFLFELR